MKCLRENRENTMWNCISKLGTWKFLGNTHPARQGIHTKAYQISRDQFVEISGCMVQQIPGKGESLSIIDVAMEFSEADQNKG